MCDSEPVRHACVSLTTDYGAKGGFVGMLHAVVARIAPEVRVIDVDHAIPPHDVLLGALRMERAMRYLPPGVHVGVVDPGVGTTRRPVAVSTTGGEHVLVGPDNGLLRWAADACGGVAGAVVLDQAELWLDPRTATFDGRDVFAPVAAHLANGVALGEVGSALDPEEMDRLDRPLARLDGGREAELAVLQVDGFGNVQLAGDPSLPARVGIEPGHLVEATASGDAVWRGGVYGRTFGDVPEGEMVLLTDSDGCLALSVNKGSAADLLGLPTAFANLTIRVRPGRG